MLKGDVLGREYPPSPPPLTARNPEVVGSNPPTSSVRVFFALQCSEAQEKCTILFTDPTTCFGSTYPQPKRQKQEVGSWLSRFEIVASFDAFLFEVR